MKKSRIKSIKVHTLPLTDKKKNEVDSILSRIYANHISQILDSMHLSHQQKAEIIKELLQTE